VSRLAVVTGASGFVGGAVASELVAARYTVRAVARSRGAQAAIQRIVGGRVAVVAGDVLEPDSMADAFAGSDLVVHAAGMVAACRRDPSSMLRANVLGTRNVVTAAARAHVPRLVLTSSAATIGQRPGEVGHEDTPHRGWFASAYERSKAEAEFAAFALGRELGIEIVAVNPASVQGPGRLDGMIRLFIAAARGRLPIVVRTSVSFVDVADCARGHVLAATKGRPGQRYLFTGATMTTDEILAMLRRITGRGRRPIRVPASAVTAAAGVVEVAYALARRDPPICREVAVAVAHGRAYDGSRATRELGLRYTPPEETIRRTLTWLNDIGRLRCDGDAC
jgi:dihydroflavonol-4-reductase